MVMLSFDNMDLSKIGLEAIDPADLYCQDNSPLQNQTLYPGCYGICAVSSPFQVAMRPLNLSSPNPCKLRL